MNDHYRVLGIDRDASPDELKRAYRRLVQTYHPDVNPSPEAEERLKEVREAYEALNRIGPEETECGNGMMDESGFAFETAGENRSFERDGSAKGASEAGESGVNPSDGFDISDRKRQKPTAVGGAFILLFVLLTACGLYVQFFSESNHLVLTREGRQWKLDLNQIGYDGENASSIDEKQFDRWLDQVRKEVDRPAENAEVKRLGDPIRPGRKGKVMDVEMIREKWLPILPKLVNRPQSIPMKVDRPTVTKKDLQRVDQKRLSSYTTYFDGSNQSRIHNIRLSGKALNNRVLNPGEIFSFNREVGPRTRERGYLPAPSVVEGKYCSGVEGGVCQTSSTLFNSVDRAGLTVVSRFSHFNTDTYVSAERDATVSWERLDFRFRNPLQEPIVLKIQVKDESITVQVYSTPEAKTEIRHIKNAPRTPEYAGPDQPSAEPDSDDSEGGDSRDEDENGDGEASGEEEREASSSTGGSRTGSSTGGDSDDATEGRNENGESANGDEGDTTPDENDDTGSTGEDSGGESETGGEGGSDSGEDDGGASEGDDENPDGDRDSTGGDSGTDNPGSDADDSEGTAASDPSRQTC
ncbi:VanW family protein [Paludifilum halophilum]|uniref:J domain-containing protein n=1 Tax=Paludifilum halophilum TaxID=1642702 RepID=A0A235B6P4_9BACL|nr:VanW family protein [Paludifilum halophilum]OYD07973.1 hypothetical protein CHM34_07590 [Paludifilum halophilum]